MSGLSARGALETLMQLVCEAVWWGILVGSINLILMVMVVLLAIITEETW